MAKVFKCAVCQTDLGEMTRGKIRVGTVLVCAKCRAMEDVVFTLLPRHPAPVPDVFDFPWVQN